MARILCSRRYNSRALTEALARLDPPTLRRFAIWHRTDEDENLVTQVIAANEAEAREEMERILQRSDFVVREVG